MILTEAVSDRDSSWSSTPYSTGSGRSRRYQYSRLENRWLKHVIVDVDAQGDQDWAEQAPGEMRWYSFRPSADERAWVATHLFNGSKQGGTLLLFVASTSARRRG